MLGFNVVEPSAVIITHLLVVRTHAHELLTRRVASLLDNLEIIAQGRRGTVPTC
jgi:flagellar biosynthesis component FlhA